jgi:hypothetical protein
LTIPYQVVDYSSNPDEDKSNIKCEFDGEQLKEFLEGMYRPADDEGKPLGVRWSNSGKALVQ